MTDPTGSEPPTWQQRAQGAAKAAGTKARGLWHAARRRLRAGKAFVAARTAPALAWVKARQDQAAAAIQPVIGPLLARIRPLPPWFPRFKKPQGPFVRRAAIYAGWTGIGGIAAILAFFVYVTHDMPSTNDLWSASDAPSITFLDRNGRVIRREGAEAAPPVDIDTLPPYVGQAFVAIEDRRFEDHWGVDFMGLMRAAWLNIRSGAVVQGGSTITQQLAKNLFLSNERTFRRKAQEFAMAIWLETRFSKEDLLALYLSRVYFGAGAWGIEAASERYFDIPASQLSLTQAALLAGLVKAPSDYNPARNEEAARERANLVLQAMAEQGYITEEQRLGAVDAPIQVTQAHPNDDLGYFRDWIDPLLNDVIGHERGDYVVETTIDIEAQRAAQASIERHLSEEGDARGVSQAALVSLDDTGGIVAMVGGRDYGDSQFNRATQAGRQPGSAFKYFVYLAAMERGYTPWTVRVDAPVTYGDWQPRNFDGEFAGPVSLTSAYARSINTVAVQLANEVGGSEVIATARRLGITSPLRNYRSLALGAQDMTLIELTQAYGALASEGRRLTPHGVLRIRRVDTPQPQVVWESPHAPGDVVIEGRAQRFMNMLMSRVVEAGTGTRARIQGRQIGGKTGTGNNYRDAWFIGYTPGVATGVWVGNDQFADTQRVTGGSLPAAIWHDFMLVALEDVPVRALAMPGDGDYSLGPSVAAPETPIAAAPAPVVRGAPLGAPLGGGPPVAAADDGADRSLDFGPEG
jgi:penicillin-binding protein 1A